MARARKEVEEAEELKKRLVPWYAAPRTTVVEATNRWQAPPHERLHLNNLIKGSQNTSSSTSLECFPRRKNLPG